MCYVACASGVCMSRQNRVEEFFSSDGAQNMLGLFVLYVRMPCQIGAMHFARWMRGKGCSGTNAHTSHTKQKKQRVNFEFIRKTIDWNNQINPQYLMANDCDLYGSSSSHNWRHNVFMCCVFTFSARVSFMPFLHMYLLHTHTNSLARNTRTQSAIGSRQTWAVGFSTNKSSELLLFQRVNPQQIEICLSLWRLSSMHACDIPASNRPSICRYQLCSRSHDKFIFIQWTSIFVRIVCRAKKWFLWHIVHSSTGF